MPAPHDLDPDAMTEEERLAKRRYHAGFAFTMMHPVLSRDQFPERNGDEDEGDGDGGDGGGE